MSDPQHQHSVIPVEGWYQDPEGGHRQRYWTGSSWSEESRVSHGRKKKEGEPNRLIKFLKSAAVWAGFAAFMTVVILFGIHMMELENKAPAPKKTGASSVIIGQLPDRISPRI